MKNLFLILAVTVISTNFLLAQTQSVTLEQLKIYETNKAKYINKPLICLLKDIEYPIKKFYAFPNYKPDSVNIIELFFSDTITVFKSGYKPILIYIDLYQNEDWIYKPLPYPRAKVRPKTWQPQSAYIDSIGHVKIRSMSVLEMDR